ncbi:MAG: TIR domain-containing protein [Verrucomicrobiaceae bacterium]|nr:TIR domain-containing protein [Verrucomicrobiaceae bacterium]
MSVPHVFISHSSKDRQFIERVLLPPLREHGVRTWFSPHDIPSRADWEKTIRAALNECDWFLVALSPDAIKSDWVQAEVHWALDNRKGRFVSTILETCTPSDLHLQLIRYQHIDFRGDTAAAIRKLLAVWSLEEQRSLAVEFMCRDEPAAPARTVLVHVRDLVRIGRAPNCDLLINSPCVSRFHAFIEHEAREGKLWLITTGAKAGTRVNGNVVTERVALAEGDKIEAGDATIIVQRIISSKVEPARAESDTERPVSVSVRRAVPSRRKHGDVIKDEERERPAAARKQTPDAARRVERAEAARRRKQEKARQAEEAKAAWTKAVYENAEAEIMAAKRNDALKAAETETGQRQNHDALATAADDGPTMRAAATTVGTTRQDAAIVAGQPAAAAPPASPSRPQLPVFSSATGKEPTDWIHFQCSVCGIMVAVPGQLAGKQGRCERCAQRITAARHSLPLSAPSAGPRSTASISPLSAIKNPPGAAAACAQARQSYATGDYAKAQEQFSQAIQVESGKASHYAERAAVWCKLGKPDDAVADLSTAIALEPENTSFYNQRGIVTAFTLAKYAEALADFNKVIGSARPSAVNYHHRGRTLSFLGKHVEALADHEKAIELGGKDAVYYCFRGVARRNLGDLAGAMADLDRALAIDPKHAFTIQIRNGLLETANQARLAELRKTAEERFAREHWETAAMAFEELLALGQPLGTHGPRLVRCLLNAHEMLLDAHARRIEEILGQLEREKLVETAKTLRTEFDKKKRGSRRSWLNW